MRAPAGLLLLACLTAACLPTGVPVRATPPAPMQPPRAAPVKVGLSRAPTATEARRIRELMSATERLRELRFRAPVAVRIQDRRAMRAYVESALDDVELARVRRRYLALGLLDPTLDVRELTSALMEEELLGYYDPKQKYLAIREDVASTLSRAAESASLAFRATVVHELVHALQDQHLGLSEAMERERTTDEENAFGAVVEGDATFAMMGYLEESQGSSLAALAADRQGLARSLRDNASAPAGRLAAAPAIVREPLLFRYREGALLAAALYAQEGWAAIDRAHGDAPTSTYAVSEPSRYIGRADTPRVTLPELVGLDEHGCALVDRDVLGSLELAAALASPALPLVELARSWRGDEYAVLRCGDRDASLWLLRFAAPAAARKARLAFDRQSSLTGEQRVIVQNGAQVLVSRNLPRELAARLFSAARGSPAGEAREQAEERARDSP
jgi:hypothetical protein